MIRVLALAAVVGLFAAPAAPAVPVSKPRRVITYLDLQGKANGKLKESFHGGATGNNLANVPTGEQKFGGVPFFIGAGLIQLGGKGTKGLPDKVEGVPVGRPFAKLHMLQAVGTGYSSPDGTVVARYVVRYHDGAKRTIDVVSGQDVRDWWYYPNSRGVSRAKVAWQGDNPVAKKGGARVRLYLTTWTNPQPKKKVDHIDFVSTQTTPAQPFCVALTVEGK